MRIHNVLPKGDNIPGFVNASDTEFFISGKPYEVIPEVKLKSLSEPPLILENVLDFTSILHVTNKFREMNVSAPVTKTGFKEINSAVGSVRTTAWAPKLADSLWGLISPWLTEIRPTQFTSTDFHQQMSYPLDTTWVPIGISPMMRYMEYSDGGEHYAHYDAGYLYPNQDKCAYMRTLKSVVLYLSTNDTGATRLIKDCQDNNPVWERNHEDYTFPVDENYVIYNSFPVKGRAFIFNHRQFHDVSLFKPKDKNEKRIIIRTDIIYYEKNST